MRKIFIILGVVFLLMQAIHMDLSNPPVKSDLKAPEDVKAILKRSCYDCHSHQTKWPWYSYVAPVSWLVAHDVNEAREELNFSLWEKYAKNEYIKEDIYHQIEKRNMPLPIYLIMHPDARLSDEEIAVIKTWAN